jgi:hypothetical protein
MFDDWKHSMTQYIQKHIDRKPFASLSAELDEDIALLSECYTTVLLQNSVIDRDGNETSVDFDEDDLLEAMLDNFLQSHADCGDERELIYAELVDRYLALVEQASEDI